MPPLVIQQLPDEPGGQQNQGNGEVHGQPGHLLARPTVEDEASHVPVDQERHERNGETSTLLLLNCYHILFNLAFRLSRWTTDQEVYSAQQAEQDGQEFVHGHEDQVIEPGLSASRYLLLRQPITETAHHTRGETVAIGEHRGEEGDKDGIEDSRTYQPPSPIPP